MTATEPDPAPQALPVLLAELVQRGAGSAPHMQGTVLEHLKGVHQLLVDWRNPAWVCAAGLYHSFYGTDRLDRALGAATERPAAVRLLGRDAEDLVWHYGACDFPYFQASLLAASAPRYRNRFTGVESTPPVTLLRGLAELLVANEMELALASATYREKKRALLQGVVQGRPGLLTPGAVAAVWLLLAGPDGRGSDQVVPGASSASTARAAASE